MQKSCFCNHADPFAHFCTPSLGIFQVHAPCALLCVPHPLELRLCLVCLLVITVVFGQGMGPSQGFTDSSSVSTTSTSLENLAPSDVKPQTSDKTPQELMAEDPTAIFLARNSESLTHPTIVSKSPRNSKAPVKSPVNLLCVVIY